MTTRSSVIRTLVGIGCALATTAACSGSSDAEFVYTPVPYTVVMSPSGTPIPWAAERDEGRRYRVDEVVAYVDRDHATQFLTWAREFDFNGEILMDDPSMDVVMIALTVPVGAARAARDFIQGRPGVEAVDVNYTLQEHDGG